MTPSFLVWELLVACCSVVMLAIALGAVRARLEGETEVVVEGVGEATKRIGKRAGEGEAIGTGTDLEMPALKMRNNRLALDA